MSHGDEIMKPLRNILIGVIGVALLLGGGLWLARGQIAMKIYRRGAEQAMASNPFSNLPDGLHVGLCGSGAPLPDPHRAGPCTAVIAGDRMFIVDIGDGATRNLTLMNMTASKADALFLTHYHSDHIGGLGELMLQHWAGGASKAPLAIYGPQGLESVVNGFQSAYVLDRGYRIAHHGEKVVPPSGFGGAPHVFEVHKDSPDIVLIDTPDLKVTAFPVKHDPVEPAVGYKFVYKGRSVVLSGDTAPSARVEAEARGADLLVHEALSPRLVGIQREAAIAAHRDNIAAISHDILSYHTTPEQAAELAERAHVKYLLLSHLVPGIPIPGLEGPFVGDAASRFHGTFRLGHDGDFISMPAHSTQITRSNRMLRIR